MTVEIDAAYVWRRVEVRDAHECWPWLGNRNQRGGHGVAYIGAGRSMSAHRAVYQIVNGPVDEGLVLDHVVCQHPWCVNPMHCEPVTQLVNVRRGGVSAANRRRVGWRYPNRREVA